MAAALSKNARGDLTAFLEDVAQFVEQACPGMTSRRTTGFFKKSLVGIDVTFDAFRLALNLERGSVSGSFTRMSGGIALKSERLTLAEWNELLIQKLEERAAADQEARDSMKRLLGL